MTGRSARSAAPSITRGAGDGWRGPKVPSRHCARPAAAYDKFPAGVVTLQGAFAREHKEEIIRLVRHQEEAEKREHPLNRIISIEEDADGFVINTTDIHLPRRIGEGVKRAFHGKLEDLFEKDGYFVRVNWSREA